LKQFRNLEFSLVLILFIASIILSAIGYLFWYNLLFFVGPYFFVHWLAIIATISIGVFILFHYILKYIKPKNYKIILRIHVFVNLFSFLAISLHFGQNLGRLIGFPQRLTDGFTTYILLIIIVTTGILRRYKPSLKLSKYNKIIHKYTVILLFLILIIHALQGFNIIF
jgi:hypothetical protein